MRLHKQSKHGESSIIAFKQNLKSHKQLKHKGYHSKKNGQKTKQRLFLMWVQTLYYKATQNGQHMYSALTIEKYQCINIVVQCDYKEDSSLCGRSINIFSNTFRKSVQSLLSMPISGQFSYRLKLRGSLEHNILRMNARNL